MLLGVFFHAAISFMATPLGWAVQDRSTSLGVDAFTFVSHAFRMPVFFLLSGFFSRLLIEKRGLNEFLKQRLKRLGGPLLAFWPLVAVSLFFLWRWGRSLPGQPKAQVGGLNVPEDGIIVSPAHLWFIYYLLLIAVGAWAVARVKAGAWADRVIRPWLLVPATAAVLLTMRPLEIETPITFVPDVRILAFYAIFFAQGWFLHRNPERIAALGKRLPLTAVAALAVFAGMLPLLDRVGRTHQLGNLHAAGALALALLSWSLVAVFVGCFVRWMSTERPWIAWLSDAAYWVYLIHLPICVALQVWIAPKPWWGPLKYALVSSFTLGVCLISYRAVRTTAIGAWLHGPRKALTVAPSAAQI